IRPIKVAEVFQTCQPSSLRITFSRFDLLNGRAEGIEFVKEKNPAQDYRGFLVPTFLLRDCQERPRSIKKAIAAAPMTRGAVDDFFFGAAAPPVGTLCGVRGIPLTRAVSTETGGGGSGGFGSPKTDGPAFA